ncbi:hypothetical protein [Paenibacillus sp. NPDC057967]|uniref:hypothetical protein n=1 Tax=Paenibacillus sp. NPDC057967 TaxID=3346293 RepID=UPI0036D8A459
MNKMKLFKSVAASTLLLSAFASTSVFANPKTVDLLSTGSAVKVEGKLIKGEEIPALQAVMLPDPVELAREYAPDTAEDWEATLKQYHELLKDTFSIRILNEDGVQLPEGEATVMAVQAISGENVDASMFITDEAIELKAAGALQFNAATAKSAATVSDTAAADIKFDVVKDLDASQFTATAVATKPSPLFETHSKLAKAAEDKDAAGIRETLADLLAEYKEEIQQLQAEDK